VGPVSHTKRNGWWKHQLVFVAFSFSFFFLVQDTGKHIAEQKQKGKGDEGVKKS